MHGMPPNKFSLLYWSRCKRWRRTPSPDGEGDQSTVAYKSQKFEKTKVRNLHLQTREWREGQRFEELSFQTMAATKKRMQKHKKSTRYLHPKSDTTIRRQ